MIVAYDSIVRVLEQGKPFSDAIGFTADPEADAYYVWTRHRGGFPAPLFTAQQVCTIPTDGVEIMEMPIETMEVILERALLGETLRLTPVKDGDADMIRVELTVAGPDDKPVKNYVAVSNVTGGAKMPYGKTDNWMNYKSALGVYYGEDGTMCWRHEGELVDRRAWLDPGMDEELRSQYMALLLNPNASREDPRTRGKVPAAPTAAAIPVVTEPVPVPEPESTPETVPEPAPISIPVPETHTTPAVKETPNVEQQEQKKPTKARRTPAEKLADDIQDAKVLLKQNGFEVVPVIQKATLDWSDRFELIEASWDTLREHLEALKVELSSRPESASPEEILEGLDLKSLVLQALADKK